jgi:hypothetical protein
MGWPPQVGELLPDSHNAVGVRRKLWTYSLDITHEDGGPKARGFALVLGITRKEINYLEEEILRKVQEVPIKSVRQNPPHGLNCVVEFPLRGVGAYSRRVVPLRTIWEFKTEGSPPRLVGAFLKP